MLRNCFASYITESSVDLIYFINVVIATMNFFKHVICQKGFTTNSNLASHVRSAHEKINFFCSLCNKVFLEKTAWKKQQHKKKLFIKGYLIGELECKVCFAKFTRTTDLIQN